VVHSTIVMAGKQHSGPLRSLTIIGGPAGDAARPFVTVRVRRKRHGHENIAFCAHLAGLPIR
jgi:hypothetical protein